MGHEADSDLPFSAGRNQHPRHVWGAHAGLVHAGDRVSFCELEGKGPAFPSPLSTLPPSWEGHLSLPKTKKLVFFSIELNKT